MSLPRSDSRRITVENERLRWVVSPDSGFMVLVAEAEHGQGQRLEATVTYGETEGAPQLQITPRRVQRVIELALQGGWQPGQPGLPSFRMDDAERRVWADEE